MVRQCRIIAEGRYPFHSLHTHCVGLDDVERAIKILGGEIEDKPVTHITVSPASGAATTTSDLPLQLN